MSASFSKHTFSRSIFRTVTCNKVLKERRCSCLFVLDLDLGTVSLSGSEKSEHYFLSPSRALLQLIQGVYLCVSLFVCCATLKPASDLAVPALQQPQQVAFASEKEMDVFLHFREEDRLVKEVGPSRKLQMRLAERNS